MFSARRQFSKIRACLLILNNRFQHKQLRVAHTSENTNTKTRNFCLRILAKQRKNIQYFFPQFRKRFYFIGPLPLLSSQCGLEWGHNDDLLSISRGVILWSSKLEVLLSARISVLRNFVTDNKLATTNCRSYLSSKISAVAFRYTVGDRLMLM